MIDFATADLCDANEGRCVALEPMFVHFGGLSRFCGPVQTVKAFEDNVLVKTELGRPGQGRVLVVDAGASLRCAMVGDVLARTAADQGWAGILVYGAVRDSAALGRMPLGVLALGTHPMKSVKKGAGEVGIPVTFAGQTIRVGLWLYADEDGVILADTPLT